MRRHGHRSERRGGHTQKASKGVCAASADVFVYICHEFSSCGSGVKPIPCSLLDFLAIVAILQSSSHFLDDSPDGI